MSSNWANVMTNMQKILFGKIGQQFQHINVGWLNYFRHKGHIISVSDYLQKIPENLVRWHGKNSE